MRCWMFTYDGKSIYDILELTVDEAIEFFGSQKGTTEKTIARKLTPWQMLDWDM